MLFSLVCDIIDLFNLYEKLNYFSYDADHLPYFNKFFKFCNFEKWMTGNILSCIASVLKTDNTLKHM